MGLFLEEAQPDPMHTIYLENAAALTVYMRLHNTQWRSGMNGLVGLDYGPLAFFLELEQVPRERWPEVVDGVQLLEAEVLRQVREKADA